MHYEIHPHIHFSYWLHYLCSKRVHDQHQLMVKQLLNALISIITTRNGNRNAYSFKPVSRNTMDSHSSILLNYENSGAKCKNESSHRYPYLRRIQKILMFCLCFSDFKTLAKISLQDIPTVAQT